MTAKVAWRRVASVLFAATGVRMPRLSAVATYRRTSSVDSSDTARPGASDATGAADRLAGGFRVGAAIAGVGRAACVAVGAARTPDDGDDGVGRVVTVTAAAAATALAAIVATIGWASTA